MVLQDLEDRHSRIHNNGHQASNDARRIDTTKIKVSMTNARRHDGVWDEEGAGASLSYAYEAEREGYGDGEEGEGRVGCVAMMRCVSFRLFCSRSFLFSALTML